MEDYKFVQNRSCEYFPCHDIPRERFNCLFCYCPLYCLGDKCGGDFQYSPTGIKSCINCTKPHDLNGYNHVMNHIREVMDLAQKNREI